MTNLPKPVRVHRASRVQLARPLGRKTVKKADDDAADKRVLAAGKPAREAAKPL